MHKVKCPICNEDFDTDKVAWLPYGKRRYAHKSCMEKVQNVNVPASDQNGYEAFRASALAALAESRVNSTSIMDYCHWLFSGKGNYVLIGQQLEQYLNGYNFTPAGVMRTLYWFYELTGHSKENWNSIGIVPYVYHEAKEFYLKKYVSDTTNANIPITHEVLKVRISPPKV